MSFLYPHTVVVYRPGAQTGAGKLAYGGQTQTTEQQITPNPIACNIELRREGQKNTTGLPGDANRPTYDVRIPRAALANGMVLDRDILMDGLGQRYVVQSNYWNSLGYTMRAERLEA
jgi:hypothetical protein